MKKRFVKFLVLAIAVLLSVLFIAPATIYAQPVLESIEIIPEYGEIPAIGQTTQFNALAHYDVGDPVDITADAATSWGTDNTSVATITAGVATGVGEGGTGIAATYEGVIGYAWVNVWKPSLWVDVGLPGETTGFGIWADGCSGLPWALNVTGPTLYSGSGIIPSDPWNPYFNVPLSAGDYEAVFSVGGVVQDTKNFSVWEHEAWMDVNPGYSGEETKITLNATYSDGGAVYFEIIRYSSEDDTWYQLDWMKTNVAGDSWSQTLTYTLGKGLYQAGFSINNRWEAWQEFSIVDRGVPQPPVEEKPVPEKLERRERIGKRGPAINEKPLSDYDKTNSGFATLFYNRLLSRNPEQEGLDAWIGRLESGAITGADLVYQFIFGEECQSIISDYTSEEFIIFLYKALFNREPEDYGFNTWLARINDGMTREEVVDRFTHSEEFVNLCKEFGVIPYEGYISTTE